MQLITLIFFCFVGFTSCVALFPFPLEGKYILVTNLFYKHKKKYHLCSFVLNFISGGTRQYYNCQNWYQKLEEKLTEIENLINALQNKQFGNNIINNYITIQKESATSNSTTPTPPTTTISSVT